MELSAIIFFIVASLIIWGGLIVSSVFLISNSEVDYYPEGVFDD
jgi:hypothetical protein